MSNRQKVLDQWVFVLDYKVFGLRFWVFAFDTPAPVGRPRKKGPFALPAHVLVEGFFSVGRIFSIPLSKCQKLF